MKSKNHRPLRVAAACSMLACGLAQAQQPAAAAAADDKLPEIVVTGERTARSLARTAASVSVLTARDFGDRPALLTQRDVLDSIVNVTATGKQNLAAAVRGIDGTGPSQGADAFLAGTRSRLAYVVDGRPASFNELSFGDLGLWDMERVEIFRGAQSTLQGRNTIAGTIVYKTADPGFEPEYAARLAFGSDSQRQASALLSLPLSDQVAVRLAVDRSTSDNVNGGFEPYAGIADPGQYSASNVRAKILVKPTALRDFKTVVTLARTSYRAPQTEAVARPFEDRRIAYPAMPVFSPVVTSAVAETAWKLSDRWSLDNTLGAGKYRINRHAVPGDGNAQIDGRDFTLEPRLRYTAADGGLSVLTGFYGFRSRQDETIDLFGGGAYDDKTRTAALYSEATVALSPVLELTAGGRYEREHRLRLGSLAFFTTHFDEKYSNFLPRAALAWKADATTTLGLSVARSYNGGNAGFTYDEPYVNYTYKPEYVVTTELFGRSRLDDDRVQLSANVFFSRYRDMQLPFDLNPDPAVWAYVVKNAPRAETYGAEFGVAWLPVRELKLKADLGLLRARITEYPDSGVQGHELPRSPKASLVLGAVWRHVSGLELGGSARYSTAYYSDVTNVARGRVSPGWTADLNAGYSAGPARFYAFVANVFDAKRPLLIEADPGAADDAADTAIMPRPRSWGVGAEVRF